MSTKNLVEGIDALFKGLNQRKKNQKEFELAQAKAAARLLLSEELGGSLEGKTTKGRMIADALKTGALDPKDAIAQLGNLKFEDIYYGAHAHAQSIKDPVEKAQLLQAINESTRQMGNVNYLKNFYSSMGSTSGKFEARKKYGVPLYIVPGGAKSGTESVSGQDNVSYTMSLPGFREHMANFQRHDPIGQMLGPDGIPVKKLSNDDIEAYNERSVKAATHFIDGVNSQSPIPLDAVQLKQVYATAASDYMWKGPGGLVRYSSKDGVTTPSPYGVSISIPRSAILNSNPATVQNFSGQGQNPTTIKRKKNQPPSVLVNPKFPEFSPTQKKKGGALNFLKNAGASIFDTGLNAVGVDTTTPETPDTEPVPGAPSPEETVQ